MNTEPGPQSNCEWRYITISGSFLEALGPLGAIVSAMVALTDGAVFKFFMEAPGTRTAPADCALFKYVCAGSPLGPRIALYKSATLDALGKVRVGPKWPKKYSTLKGGTALVAIS